MISTIHPVPMFAAVIPTTTETVIPPITDPLGRHWDQPDTSNFVIDDTHALMTRRDFEQLAEYSTTTPSGVYVGKCWKERSGMLRTRPNGEWYLRWYGHDPDPNFVSNNQRIILIID